MDKRIVTPADPVSIADSIPTSRAVFEIRRRSGLDWDELAVLLGASRSDVCDWANGRIRSTHIKTVVLCTLAAIQHIDRGSSKDTRSFLLNVDETTGTSVLDLLSAGRFDEVMAIPGRIVPPRPRPALSKEAKMLRRPEPPMLLLDADHSRPVIATTPRVAKVIRPPSPEE